MRRDSLRALLVLLSLGALVLFNSGCAEMQKQFVDPFTADSRPRTVEPDFEWDPAFASPGASLTIEEANRIPTGGEGGTMLQYRLTAEGFPVGEALDLWWKRGTSFQKMPATVTAEGTVLVVGMDILAAAGLVKGQAVDLALASGETRAQAKTVPFPIQSRTGKCWASVELESESGLLFLVSLGGFETAEQVEVTSSFRSERHADTMEASEAGEISFPVLFGKGDRGMANILAKGTSGSVAVGYEVGKDALVPR